MSRPQRAAALLGSHPACSSPCWFQRADLEEFLVCARRRFRPWFLAFLGAVVTVATVAATAPAASGRPVVALAADTGPCGSTGVLTNATACSYTTVGSDRFTVPAGVDSVVVDVVGAQGGRYFIAGDAAHGGSPAGDVLSNSTPGRGGEAAGTLTGLTTGQILQVDVAGKGADGTAASRSGGMMNGPSGGRGALGGFGGSNGGVAGGPGDASGGNGGTALFNGGNGSGGGGSSDVRVAASGCAALDCALSDRVLVGAGGGGVGGIGGSGQKDTGAGGDGGGNTGADGGTYVGGGNPGASGTGATQSGPGAGGLNPARHPAPPASPPSPTHPAFGRDGADGSSATGGAGGDGNGPCLGVQTPACS
ncbi:MAG TPA: hypothetical protein VFA63_09540, partial [Pseudonocardiaceae bacterium]|nr:hypothetical protein [Pseudonocardiaceae bacterium]